jgi:hypothetical protein
VQAPEDAQPEGYDGGHGGRVEVDEHDDYQDLYEDYDQEADIQRDFEFLMGRLGNLRAAFEEMPNVQGHTATFCPIWLHMWGGHV